MLRLDHVGIAVESLDRATAVLGPLLGAEPTAVEEVHGQRVRVLFLGDGDGRLELLEATSPDSAIARHIERRGAGLHHLAFRVTDLAGALRRLEAAGYQLVDREPRPGAGGHMVAFLHPRSTGGVLIELVQAD
ncbi:MAG TPA: methylmalonyl-CoA epimerase [Longimicrobiales bacterium]|nr:methylmalonyl-CoA epimerase [Longimicrobiales bacterium]